MFSKKKIQIYWKQISEMESKDFSKLDLAFVLDTTSSMGSYIENAKNVSLYL